MNNNFFLQQPELIEQKSMEMIENSVDLSNFNEQEKVIARRLIHATGDLGIASEIVIHPQAITTAKACFARKTRIITDVAMVKSGISPAKLSRYDIEVKTLIHDNNVHQLAREKRITRAMAAIELTKTEWAGEIVAIGNAPTALFHLLDLIAKGAPAPALIIGIPVGFVGAAESKEALIAQGQVPFITVRGTKGGSPMAAAAINALLTL